MKDRRVLSRIGRAARMLAALAAPAWPQAPDAQWVGKTVHGYRIALAVQILPDPGGAREAPQARLMQHRIVVSIQDAATERPVEAASVSLDVAEQGYQGSPVPMRPASSGEAGIYEASVGLARKAPQRVLVHATPRAGGRTLEAQFEYRHHH